MSERSISPNQRLRENPEWVARAECADNDPELFVFMTNSASEKRSRFIEARKICSKCPVILECLAEAIKKGEDDGTWGGVPEGHRGLFKYDMSDPSYDIEAHLNRIRKISA